jgi:hypothetical protein
MKRGVNLDSHLPNKIFYIIIALVILGAVIVGVRAATTGLVAPVNPGHNSSQVLISVGTNKYITLQDAVDSGFLLGQNFSNVRISLIPVTTPYELASQVIVTFKGQKMTLQEAVATNVFVNNALQVGFSYSTITPVGGDISSNVNINTTSGNMTLQNAINTGLALLSSACLTGFVCPQGQKIGNPCYPTGLDSSCVNAGTITSSATCSGYSNMGVGASCIADGSKTCNGNGICEGWSGYGCSGCPFGSSSSGSYSCCNSNSAESVGLVSYCNFYQRSCSSGSCSTTDTNYAWSMEPAASGNNYASCAPPVQSGSGSSGGSHGGAPASTVTGSGTSTGGGTTISGAGSDGPGDGTASA